MPTSRLRKHDLAVREDLRLGLLNTTPGPGSARALHRFGRSLGGRLRYLLARTLGFDPALLEESDRFLVELFFSTGVPTVHGAYLLVVKGFQHHH